MALHIKGTSKSVAVAVLAVVAAGGCGGQGSSTAGSGPASVSPSVARSSAS